MINVLLPSDFSANAYNAAEYAVKLFWDNPCMFYLLNTFTPVLYDSDYIIYSSTQPGLEEIYRNNSLKGLERLQKYLTHHFKNPQHNFENIAAFNLLIEEIRELADAKAIDLIVMGTQGATGAQEILMGTNTVQVINKVHIPILAIPAVFRYKKPANILFPTDFEIDFTPGQLQILLEIQRSHQGKIEILHVLEKKELNKDQEKNKRQLMALIKDLPHQLHSVEGKSISREIQHFQENHSIDMLVMINNKHSFFENLLFRPVINKIGFHIKVPFLVIPSGKYHS